MAAISLLETSESAAMTTNLQLPILVFLPPAAARLVVSKLQENGYSASAASSIPELQRSLHAAQWSLVVTTRPDIDLVRNIRPLPVVNLEIFFHSDLHAGTLEGGTKQFDTKAFMGRIDALTQPRPAREPETPARSAPSLPQLQTRIRRWFLPCANAR